MEQLIAEVRAYATLRDIKPDTVLQLAANLSGTTWKKWVDGKSSCTLKTMDRIRKYMADNPAECQSSDAA